MTATHEQNRRNTALDAAYQERTPGSGKLHEQARRLIPGGITHDNRHLRPYPPYIDHAQGAYKWDVDGNRYIDYWVGHGALILGHGFPPMVQAVHEQVEKGTHMGADHAWGVQWARLVTDMVPCAESVRFCLTGTEATMLSLRVARGYTGREKILKLQSHFHGWHDYVSVGLKYPFDVVSSRGVPRVVAETVTAVPPNDLEAIGTTLATGEYAAIILEPGGGSNNRVPFHEGVLAGIRELASRYGSLLIFDEIITGFRYAPGGAQERYGILPDLTTLGKIVGGGLPSSALCGKRKIMETIAFTEDAQWDRFQRVMHTGTFNAHPLAAVAGGAVLDELQDGTKLVYTDALGSRLRKGLNEVIGAHGIQGCCHGESSIYHVLLNNDCDHVRECDMVHCDNGIATLCKGMGPLKEALRVALLIEGVDELGDGGWISAAHTTEDIDETVSAYDRALSRLEQAGLL
jgi:glutamate-1-semialdehyde 2,1-aminomutase